MGFSSPDFFPLWFLAGLVFSSILVINFSLLDNLKQNKLKIDLSRQHMLEIYFFTSNLRPTRNFRLWVSFKCQENAVEQCCSFVLMFHTSIYLPYNQPTANFRWFQSFYQKSSMEESYENNEHGFLLSTKSYT